MSLKKSFILILLLSMGVACKEKTPPGILTQNKLESVLVDLHLADGLYNSKYELKINYDNLDTDLYYAVLKKHDITDSVLVKTLFYYSTDPKLLNGIYDEVMNELKERNEVLLNQIKALPDSIKDTIDVGLDLEGELSPRELK